MGHLMSSSQQPAPPVTHIATYCKLGNSILSLRYFTAVCQKIVIITPHICSGSKEMMSPGWPMDGSLHSSNWGPDKSPVKYNSYPQG